MASKLVDAYGRPVSTSDLTEEVAAVRLASIRTPFYPSQADGLTPERLGHILHAADVGQILEYLTLAIEMEEREPHYASVLGTRKHAVAGLAVHVEAVSENAEDVELAEEITWLCKTDHFEAMLIDALDALGKGFSVCEIMWDTSEKDWEPSHFTYRDPRHFIFDRETQSELRMRDEADPVWGLPLAPFKFIQHRPHVRSGLPIRGGFARLAAVPYMCKGYALKDWLAFAEVFGMPLRVGKYDPGASREQKAALLAAVTNIGMDAAGIIPDSMVIEFIEATKSAGGDKLFQGLADWLDKQMSKAVLGQTMTTDDGSSRAQAEVHDGVRQDLVRSDAKQLSATLRRDLVKPYVDLNHGPRKEREYPRLELVIEQQDDLESLSKSLPPFIDRGLKVSMIEIRDKFGLGEPEEGSEMLVPAAKPGASVSGGGAVPGEAEHDESGEAVHAERPFEPTQPTEQPTEQPNAAKDTDLPGPGLQTMRQAQEALLARVMRGETLTEDQRAVLALAARGTEDELDQLAARTADDWRKAMGPLLEPIAALAARCKSPEEFRTELARLQLDASELVDVVARLGFQARGLGDTKDKV